MIQLKKDAQKGFQTNGIGLEKEKTQSIDSHPTKPKAMFGESKNIQVAPPEVKIVCFDADETLYMGHLHSFAQQRSYPPQYFKDKPEQAQQVFRNFINSGAPNKKGFRNQRGTVEAIELALQNGHKVAITSYTLYPALLRIALEKMGLSPECIEKIPIVGGYPDKRGNIRYDRKELDRSHGKERHIEKAKKTLQTIFEQDFTDNQAILVDDSENNVKITNQSGNIGIRVLSTDKSDYLKELLQFISTPVFANRQHLHQKENRAYQNERSYAEMLETKSDKLSKPNNPFINFAIKYPDATGVMLTTHC